MSENADYGDGQISFQAFADWMRSMESKEKV